MIVDAYKKITATKKFEIIFVSSDRDEAAFASYYEEMPWLALPYGERALKNMVSKKYKVQGIPTFVVLEGATAETITLDGRSAIMEDPNGSNFPWRPPSVWETLGEEVLGGDGDDVALEDLRGPGKVIGLYFSASWCPPCH
eukprot:2854704-Prymnesium_polylepis.1